MLKRLVLAALLAGVGAMGRAEDVRYPAGSGFSNVRDYGARGGGVTDDTAAVRKAIADVRMHFQVIYLPAGTYLVSDTINWEAWITLQGQAREKTLLKLKETAPDAPAAAGRPAPPGPAQATGCDGRAIGSA
jgi:hypothetical protein